MIINILEKEPHLLAFYNRCRYNDAILFLKEKFSYDV